MIGDKNKDFKAVCREKIKIFSRLKKRHSLSNKKIIYIMLQKIFKYKISTRFLLITETINKTIKI